MPVKILPYSIKYCTKDKKFFIYIISAVFIAQLIENLFNSILVDSIVCFFATGYGLLVIEDIINGGEKLPKVNFNKLLIYGIKGLFVVFVYFMIQFIILEIISSSLGFPLFDIEEFILDFKHTFYLFYTHNIVKFIVFSISGFIVVYVSTFFMELAIARLADGGTLKKAFNFPRIKRAIDIIGWKNYAWDYTRILISLLILLYLLHYEIPFRFLDAIIDTFLSFLVFLIEVIGMGMIYRRYILHKSLEKFEE
ncbi:MAG: DUF4013 domain-containing protein [Methanobrevibacter thaueri]|nr:DUF4013 domain-containing protein [Methanobrevibacter thaueri]